jgi:1-deoxy-D-xylulose-5-phosphate synthase
MPSAMHLLDSINSPSDVRKLSPGQLTDLAGEMRARIFDAVSKNGGHLASNLGVVELTLALHYVACCLTSVTNPTRTSS